MNIDEARGKECYKTLNVLRNATDEEILAAYNRCIAVAHPDTGGSHSEAMRVNQAKDVLLDPKKRAAYNTVSDRYDLDINSIRHFPDTN